MSTLFTGGCLCGAVRYESTGASAIAGHCQCHDCRRSSGSGHCSHLGVPKPAVSMTGEVTIYESAADSGNMIGRAFCPTCGAAVYSVNSGMADLIFLRASSLDDPEVFAPQVVVYTSRGPSWDLIDPDLPAFEEMPPPAVMPATDG
jgi:hypothetical protein